MVVPGREGFALRRLAGEMSDSPVTVLGPGAYKLRIPTEFAVGDVNLYAFEEPVRTLVDTGTGTASARSALHDRLRTIGWRIEQIERVVISHFHVDHYGMAGQIQQESGCEVWAHRRTAMALNQFEQHIEESSRWFERYYLESGVSADEARLLRLHREQIRDYAGPATVTQALEGGEELPLGGEPAQVIFAPGHASSLLVFHLPRRKWLLASDHVLEFITPNPCLEAPLVAGERKPRCLVEYLDSLRRLKGLQPQWILPGHGNNFHNLPQRLAQIERHIDRRSRRILTLLDTPKTRHELAVELFGRFGGWDAYLTLSEITGHLERLELEGRIVRATCDGVDLYRRQPAADETLPRE